MKKVDNKSFLEFLEKDIIRNFYLCDNIVNSGKDGYAIKSVVIYTTDDTPSNDYVVLTENIFNELIIEVKTKNESLISDVFSQVKKVAKTYKKLRIGANDVDFFNSAIFKKYFKLQKTYYADFGVFAHFSESDLVEFNFPENVSIQLETDFEKFSDYDDENWDGLESLIKYKNETDKFFVIRKTDVFCGYLMANNSYKNIYDIANVFVSENYRGKNYGAYLTSYFAKHCYENNLIPHYGTAISKYSEAVAKKCGFKESYRQHYADVKFKFISL